MFEFVPEERKKFVGKKKGATPAPVMATHGEFGAVDWLDLEVKEEMLGGYKKAYRVVTAGGKPPATCEGRPEHFEMKYATEYCKFPRLSLSLNHRILINDRVLQVIATPISRQIRQDVTGKPGDFENFFMSLTLFLPLLCWAY